MQYFVGAYAASPNTSAWEPDLEARYYQRLMDLPNVKGLEHPFTGRLHPHDDNWFIQNIDKQWRFVFTCIPGVMAALSRNPHFGIASDNAQGREEALLFLRKACEAISTLNAACGKRVVDAIQIHTAPNRAVAASSVGALKESLATLVQWDWQGARVVIEHCDAYLPNQLPSKGFLSLNEEIETVLDINARFGCNLGVVINWGRSVIEARDPRGALQHLRLAKEKGVLAGLMFSGASGADTPYGSWSDSHMPPAKKLSDGVGADGSLMTEAAMHECLRLADYKSLPILGLKIGIRPPDASLDDRVAYIRSALASLDALA
ncbi:DUF4862 family protein [Paucibacter sp. AS339]|uniref:DUF4862 family protein n=1 Tax=Paucibacter hankyongi TaxID=3133434 RepID=UPI0030A5230D